jgi:hypothetical protein
MQSPAVSVNGHRWTRSYDATCLRRQAASQIRNRLVDLSSGTATSIAAERPSRQGSLQADWRACLSVDPGYLRRSVSQFPDIVIYFFLMAAPAGHCLDRHQYEATGETTWNQQ